jgi:hypothetical protein
MFIDLVNRTIHCGQFPNLLVLGLGSRERSPASMMVLRTSTPTPRNFRRVDRSSTDTYQTHLFQIMGEGQHIAHTFVARIGSTSGWDQKAFHVNVARSGAIEIRGPVTFGQGTTSAIRRTFNARKLWCRLTVPRLLFTAIEESVEETAAAVRPARRPRQRRPTAWDRISEG